MRVSVRVPLRERDIKEKFCICSNKAALAEWCEAMRTTKASTAVLTEYEAHIQELLLFNNVGFFYSLFFYSLDCQSYSTDQSWFLT